MTTTSNLSRADIDTCNTVRTLACASGCGWSTDIEITSTTNPARCPLCGDDLVNEGTGEHFEPLR